MLFPSRPIPVCPSHVRCPPAVEFATSAHVSFVYGESAQCDCDHGHTADGKAVKKVSFAVMGSSDGSFTLWPNASLWCLHRRLWCTHTLPLWALGLSGCVGLVGAPEHLAVPSAIVANLSSAQALHSREISLLITRGSVVDEYNRLAFYNDDEFGVWTVYEMADWRTPGAVYKYWAQGQDLRFGRDQFDVDDYVLADIRSKSVPTACRRSFLSVCLQLVGDQFFHCAYSSLEIDPCF